MTIDLSKLDNQHQLLFAVELRPVQGQRFQPTYFPNLGHAVYDTPEGTCLLVESPQSMANRLETACWDEGTEDLIAPLRGLSYVRVERGGAYLTSSLQEAHRLNSAYIEHDESFWASLVAAIGLDKDEKKRKLHPIPRKSFVEAVFKFDVGSLVHGVFLESIDGRLRIARSLSAFIEARGVNVAASGGAKVDRVQAVSTEGAGAKQGFGNVIFHREEFTAEGTALFANLDLAQIRGYGLNANATRLLMVLSLFKLRALLDGKLRLRTACDFAVKSDPIISSNVEGFELPSRTELEADMKNAIPKCKAAFAGENGVTTVTFQA
ncbi:MAG: type I-U CRISPR-associated RAMP protein Csb1/Cas7u [Candidatus Binatia bacterium]